jgi:DNA (cytosine-5)-methyltransferase 1
LKAEPIIIDCSELGLPQRRRRILLVGGRGRTGEQAISSVRQLARTKHRAMTVAEALLPVQQFAGLANHEPTGHRAAWYEQIIPRIGPGQKLCDTRLGPSALHSWDVPSVFGHVTQQERAILTSVVRLRRHERHRRYLNVGDGRPVTLTRLQALVRSSGTALRKAVDRLIDAGYLTSPRRGYVDIARRFNGRFKRLPLDRPAPAVMKEFRFARNILHPTLPRGLSVRECARLQGFPDDFVFLGSRSKQYELVANAFPPPISLHLALMLIPLLARNTGT